MYHAVLFHREGIEGFLVLRRTDQRGCGGVFYLSEHHMSPHKSTPVNKSLFMGEGYLSFIHGIPGTHTLFFFFPPSYAHTHIRLRTLRFAQFTLVFKKYLKFFSFHTSHSQMLTHVVPILCTLRGECYPLSHGTRTDRYCKHA